MAVAVMSTFGATIETPLWLMIMVDAPERIMMPPDGPGTSLMTIMFWLRVCSTMLGDTGRPAFAIAGISAAEPQRQPTQIG